MKILSKKLSVMKALGVPYTDEEIKGAEASAIDQANTIVSDMEELGVDAKMSDKQIIALIAYLQRLGRL